MEERLFTRRFVAIFAANFLITMTFMLLMSFVAGFAQTRFGAGEALAGLATGSFVLGGVLARLAFGQRVDAWGRQRTLRWSLAVMLAAAAASLLIGDLGLFIAVRTVQGLAFGLATNVTNVAAMDLMPPPRRGEGTGWFTLSVTLSTALGPFLGIFLEQAAGSGAVLWVAVLCCALALLVALLTPVPEAVIDADERRRRSRWSVSDVVEPAAVPLAFIALLSSCGFSSVLSFLGAFSAAEGFREWAPIFFLAYAGCLIVTRPGAGLALDRFGDNAVAVPALLCHAAALGGLAIIGAGWQLLIVALLLALGHGVITAAFQAIAVGLADPSRRTIAVSTYYVGLDAGLGVGPLIFGAVSAGASQRGMYAAAAGLLVLAFLLYWPLHGRRPLRPMSTVGGARSSV